MRLLPACLLCAFVTCVTLVPNASTFSSAAVQQEKSSAANSASELTGLWEAKRRFGPDIRGPLFITQTKAGWQAEIAGKTAPAKLTNDEITFELAEQGNAFKGKFAIARAKIVGHWIQPPTIEGGPYASPVTLTKYGRESWRGDVSPLDGIITLFLMLKAREDGSVGVFLKNPERNIGFRQYAFDHIERDGESVKVFGARRGADNPRLLAQGKYYSDREMLSLYLPNRGGTYDFQRVAKTAPSNFYPRGRPTGTYVYMPPPALDDGWPTASLEEVGISRATIEKFIQMIIDTPIDSVSAPEMHGVLIARHGKLVLEEYFHGENRDKAHDTRSAAKSLTATLIGAAIDSGIPLKASSPVYQVMNGGTFPADLDPRKRALTLEHLLTMSSGLDCDDSDPKSPGREDFMVDESGATDYYKYTMDLKMIREPAEKAVYCSVQPNLAGGVLKAAAGKSLPVLFHQLIAEPLQMKKYYLPLTPTGDAYMGGGVRLVLRDFMKLGQLNLSGGTWNGRRILSPEWVRRSTSPLYSIGKQKYGYLWWVMEYPYNGRTLRAVYAGGNGGQVVMGIPELDLVIATYGGNYADPIMFLGQQKYIPEYILPAIQNRSR